MTTETLGSRVPCQQVLIKPGWPLLPIKLLYSVAPKIWGSSFKVMTMASLGKPSKCLQIICTTFGLMKIVCMLPLHSPCGGLIWMARHGKKYPRYFLPNIMYMKCLQKGLWSGSLRSGVFGFQRIMDRLGTAIRRVLITLAINS